MSSSYIPEKVKIRLWGRSGGTCQYRGCTEVLYEDPLTKAAFNQAYIAHIIADKPNGPRGDEILSPLLCKEYSNLMLLCDRHHRLIDKEEIERHTVKLLQQMKREHEDRIMRLVKIPEDMQSQIVIYKANVGNNIAIMNYDKLVGYLLPEYYPATTNTVDLSITNSLRRDDEEKFWEALIDDLQKQFEHKVRMGILQQETGHYSLFAFAPIPLLVKLGTLFGNFLNVKIFQLQKKEHTWKLTSGLNKVDYQVIEPSDIKKHVALNISLSADINNDRIVKILGEDVAIYTITIPEPFNDFVTDEEMIKDFSVVVRQLFNSIKKKYSGQEPIHVFPAMPISLAIELGRNWSPKADMPLYMYDENTLLGGFRKVLEIKNV